MLLTHLAVHSFKSSPLNRPPKFTGLSQVPILKLGLKHVIGNELDNILGVQMSTTLAASNTAVLINIDSTCDRDAMPMGSSVTAYCTFVNVCLGYTRHPFHEGQVVSKQRSFGRLVRHSCIWTNNDDRIA